MPYLITTFKLELNLHYISKTSLDIAVSTKPYSLPIADLPGGVKVGEAWYPLSRGQNAGKLCVRGVVQLRVKLVTHRKDDTRIARPKRISAGRSVPETDHQTKVSSTMHHASAGSPGNKNTQGVKSNNNNKKKKSIARSKKKKAKKRVISYKVDYSHVKSKTDCHNEMAYGLPDEAAYPRHNRGQLRYNQANHEDVFNETLIGESSFPISTNIDLSSDSVNSKRHMMSGHGGHRENRNSTKSVKKAGNRTQERSAPLDASTLLKMYYHGESTVARLPGGRLQLDDLERLQDQLEIRDRSGQNHHDDSSTVVPTFSAELEMDDESYGTQIKRLENEYYQLGGAGV